MLNQYPMWKNLLVAFVLLVGLSLRDFGPMRRAELRAKAGLTRELRPRTADDPLTEAEYVFAGNAGDAVTVR